MSPHNPSVPEKISEDTFRKWYRPTSNREEAANRGSGDNGPEYTLQDLSEYKSAAPGTEYTPKVKWLNTVMLYTWHTLALYTVIFKLHQAQLATVVFGFLLVVMSLLGLTAGAHRLWCHRTYKAKLPLELFLLGCFALAGQLRLRKWLIIHRVHHRYSDTDADPHNANRGLFFSHVGWMLQSPHPEVTRRSKEVDLSDILQNPLAAFYDRHYVTIKGLTFVLPPAVAVYVWGEDVVISFLVLSVLRYVIGLNAFLSINSLAHAIGTRPYRKDIKPTDNKFVSFLAIGEGWHNYHHSFPWDYKAAELGDYGFNFSTFFIDCMAKIGLAYDLKTATPDMVHNILTKYGDGSHSSLALEEHLHGQ